MKKTFILPTLLLCLCACESKDDPENDRTTDIADLFVLNQGNINSHIDGSLTGINTKAHTSYNDAFSAVNNRSLGDTPQCGVCIDNILYVGMSESNTIEIIEADTYKSISQISLTDKVGQTPRSMVYYDGYLYISMYNGYVSRLDVKTNLIESVKVGPNPEIMTIHKDALYVPNSDGMNWASGYGTTASKIDLKTFTVTETLTVPLNPDKFMSDGKNLYLLAKGNYGDIASAVYRLDDSVWHKIADATMAAIGNNHIYMVNAPYYNATGIEYKQYDTTSRSLSEWNIVAPVYPSGMTVDNKTGNIWVASMVMNGEWPSYELPCYLVGYGPDNKRLEGQYTIGSGPAVIIPRP